MKEFAVYKGDILIAMGTTQELAEFFKVKPETVKFWATPSSISRDKGNRKVAVEIEI